MHDKLLIFDFNFKIQIEEKYNEKKRKFVDSSESFQSELKKHCDPAVTEEKYKDMIKEQMEKLKKEKEERKNAPTPPPTEAAPENDRQVLQPVEKPEEMETTEKPVLEDMKESETPRGPPNVTVTNREGN